ncbi:pyruvate dehydrogenase E2 component (dihydrolipoamide acetyltransferase) [Rubrivivax gelatinosus]|uniref:Acetyltransferase component of pyruvate dehydrogenase complex n=3 Tax=Rubrivivax gelatinosus TaxID=28068 RepID=A0A4R2M018_RUBGE|nr:dihydrolipoyllysine-residue acetyltransferase [Rubrivivax gelatinosus]TCO99219.1 pyruvate dehydrogenase E2 component (dihydrolipoamide acetyltransferase) [Rubrivivax gelatinosus]
MAVVELKVPDIGDFNEVEVIELLVKPGDTVALDQSLATVESDKASMEIPAERAGTVRELKIQLGDKVSQGSVIALLEVADDAGATAAPAAAPVAPAAVPAPASAATAAPAAAPAASATGSVEVLVPDIGDFAEVTVIEVFVQPGDTVKAEQSLITVESDKASMEIPSSHGGVLRELKVGLGDKVSRGSVIAVLEVAAASAPVAPVAAPAPTGAAAAPAPAAPAATPAAAPVPAHDPTAPVSAALPHASPSIRRYARDLGVPLAEVRGSGPKGRITQEDLQSFVKGVMAGDAQTTAQKAKAPAAPAAAAGGSLPGLLPWPQVDFAKFGAVERKPLSRIKKLSGANLHRNWVLIPHVTNHEDADITELEALRVQLNKENEKSGVKVTMLAFLIKACAAALKQFPEFNASLDGDELVLKQYVHIGFAADTPNGLVVPVIRDVDAKGILQISREMSELAKKARDGKLTPAEMSGGCFSISSLGGIGGTYFTPIINAPEVAILGVCRSAMKPQWNGREFVPRLMLPLSLSWDHRVIDGAAAARFNAFLASVLADFRRVML